MTALGSSLPVLAVNMNKGCRPKIL